MQENIRLKEDNILLKAENDRLVKLLYDKEKDSHLRYQDEIDVKDRKMKMLESELAHERKLIEDLRIELVSKQLEIGRASCRERV